MGETTLSWRDYAHLAALPLDELERQCHVEAFHAHGPGGQGVNTADSAVRMRHLPTGIVVVSRESRSQFRNRRLCLAKLRAELEHRGKAPVVRRATKPTKASTQRRLEAKHVRSRVKESRKRVTGDE